MGLRFFFSGLLSWTLQLFASGDRHFGCRLVGALRTSNRGWEQVRAGGEQAGETSSVPALAARRSSNAPLAALAAAAFPSIEWWAHAAASSSGRGGSTGWIHSTTQSGGVFALERRGE